MLTEEQKEKLLLQQIVKQNESRKIRSTSMFYDEAYWGEYWSQRFDAHPREDDRVTTTEIQKKVAYIQQFYPDCKSLLDCACSFGFLPAKMQDLGWEAWGVDISQAAIQHAPERIKSHILHQSITNLHSFTNDQFDLVTAFDVFEHLYIEEIRLAVKEVNRVAKKGVLIRLPVPSLEAEPWVADLSYQGLTREHVSTYPWEFWARRFEELDKFEWWHSHCWKNVSESSCEGWVYFRRRV